MKSTSPKGVNTGFRSSSVMLKCSDPTYQCAIKRSVGLDKKKRKRRVKRRGEKG
jgi:hypothetical protein